MAVDKEASTIRNNTSSPILSLLVSYSPPNLAKTYPSYLASRPVAALSASPSPNLQRTPFLSLQPTLSRSPTWILTGAFFIWGNLRKTILFGVRYRLN